MLHAIIILTIFLILTLIVLIIVTKELNTETEERQFLMKCYLEQEKIIEEYKRKIISQKIELKHLNKLIRKKD